MPIINFLKTHLQQYYDFSPKETAGFSKWNGKRIFPLKRIAFVTYREIVLQRKK